MVPPGQSVGSTVESEGWSPAYRAIENLVERVGLGEVVFFVGAGFSLDSEGNFAWRLMRRLLWRLQAMTLELKEAVDETLRDPASVLDSEDQLRAGLQVVEGIPESLHRTFALTAFDADSWSTKQTTFWWSDGDVDKLAEKYYESNDWFCATFEKLLEVGYAVGAAAGAQIEDQAGRLDELITAIASQESRMRMPDGRAIDSVPLCRVAPCLLRWAHSSLENRRRDAGKTLFLDTMGFADEAIMGGWPALREVDDALQSNGRSRDERQRIAESYRGKLYPRHHVLARLAREGLCPVVLTTNYDLLLEGSWRLSGFEAEDAEESGSRSLFNLALPPTPLKRMAVVASPVDFVEKGKANRTSLVVKVHGCVDEYRARREACAAIKAVDVYRSELSELQRKDVTRWETYLQQMVFTYREIQNWREDSWARDYLATLQRTRSVAFVGYSLQDPVIHDAFRTVYEDMAGQRERDPESNGGGAAAREQHVAPAFFLGNAQDQSFHATEVLHAATHAAGGKVEAPHDHSNYLRFWFRHEELFPNLDDIFLWTYHRVIRERQLRMLRDDLRSVASTLLIMRGSSPLHRPLPSNLQRIEKRFRDVIRFEQQQAAKWFGGVWIAEESSRSSKARSQPRTAQHQKFRRQLQQIVRWTWYFHPALWKEFACTDTQRQRGASVHAIDSLRKVDWYQPAIAGPGRVAWAVVVELALRWLLGCNAGLSDDQCLEPRGEFLPLDEPIAALLFFHRPRDFGEVNRGALSDGLRLTCEVPGRLENQTMSQGVGVWHEWQLGADGRLWRNTEERPFRREQLRRPDIWSSRFAESSGDDEHGRRSRTIVSDVPSAVEIWKWAQGLEDDDQLGQGEAIAEVQQPHRLRKPHF
ncbi:MAG: SIR2 family protein [Planctomycetota bacterium]|jgi:hypothetical protein